MNKNSAIIAQDMSIKSTDEKPFKPTLAMEKWIDTAIDIMDDSPTRIAEESGLDRKNWYKWLKEYPGFEDWYYTEYKTRRKRWLPTLDKIGMKQAVKQYNYWEAMNKKAGEDVSQPINQVNIQNNMKIEFE